MPNPIVIADTSCLIAFSKIEILWILKALYKEVKITEEIALEYGESLPEWIKAESVKNKKYQKLLELSLDSGEASAIALALDNEESLFIIDDLKARKEALKLGLRISGTLGVLFKAKKSGIVQELKPFIEKLKVVGFRISPFIEEDLLRKCNEN